jgi:TipAS antibiotic-recognition domain
MHTAKASSSPRRNRSSSSARPHSATSTPRRPKSAGPRPTRGSSRSNGFRSSASRTGARSRRRGDALLKALAQAIRDGVEPGSARANELASRHRASIERFYDCGDEMHRNLAEMYLADERFTRYYDDVEPGLAQFLHNIVVASIDR